MIMETKVKRHIFINLGIFIRKKLFNLIIKFPNIKYNDIFLQKIILLNITILVYKGNFSNQIIILLNKYFLYYKLVVE